MRVWYRFPDMNDDDLTVSSNEKMLERHVYEKNLEIILEIDRWFKSIGERLPHPIRFESHKTVMDWKIKTAISFEMRDDLAVLFKLRFGDGTNDYQ